MGIETPKYDGVFDSKLFLSWQKQVVMYNFSYGEKYIRACERFISRPTFYLLITKHSTNIIFFLPSF